MSNKHEFRIMRQGYDRFEVDQVVNDLEHENKVMQKQMQIFKKQVETLQEQRDIIKKRYQQLVGEIAVRERAAEEMSRLALREANSIIDNARSNADMIVREAMSTSRQVLVEIARISNESNELRDELKFRIKDLEEAIDGLELPDAPNLNLYSDDQDTSK
ncbi:cell division protein DivIVA [Erysipelothrix sp. HDW6C]|uniref:DivIVA domain-containing protein n=1 Tax=Erysipelothrix sp. HDW6C TaxID=2714930 RepID=UPI001409305E|nr:DivIVA domain-containing protein [Erysipelothrix sp. HDW6C]QIK69908.1 cell division protein DivIVA [Erysipelothrix sp. HDW6C]